MRHGTNPSRGRTFLLVAVAVLATGCAGPGAGVADQIRAAHSPAILEVHVTAANWLVGITERLTIYVDPDATDAQIRELWCTVVVPAGVDQLAADHVALERAGDLNPGDVIYGSTSLDKPACH